MTLRAGWTAGLVGALGIAALAATSSCSPPTDCNDGDDNDADGLFDGDDPGCAVNGDLEAPDPDRAACADRIDNDGDGTTDLDDPGCKAATDGDEYNDPVPGCKDGIDNDDDGLFDYPNDPGCMVSLDDDEDDPCPNGTGCPSCSNGIDDDEDGIEDYPDDLGCDSAADADEFNADPSICGANVPLQPLPDDGLVIGSFEPEAPNELISLACGGSGTEAVYQLVVAETIPRLIATTNFPETEVDTVLYLRSECRESSTEITCNDDVGVTTASRIRVDELAPGTYYLVVDIRSSGTSGGFKLQVER